MTSFRAVAVTALALPTRYVREPAIEGAERGLRAAQIHGGQPQDRGRAIRGRLGATTQEATPEILFCGASVSHEVKCLSVGQRIMSVPISAIRRSAL